MADGPALTALAGAGRGAGGGVDWRTRALSPCKMLVSEEDSQPESPTAAIIKIKTGNALTHDRQAA